MSELRNCPLCHEPRYMHGTGMHVRTEVLGCLPVSPDDTLMTFWTGNKLANEFSWPIGAVRDAFLAAVGTHSPDCSHSGICGCYMRHPRLEKLDHWGVERTLRDWLTDPKGFNASWEEGPAFDELLTEVRADIYGREPDYSINHVT